MLKKNIHWTTSPVLDCLENNSKAHSMLLPRTAQGAENNPLPNTLARNMHSSHPISLCRNGGSGRQSKFLKCMFQEWKLRLETPPGVNPAVLAQTSHPVMSSPFLTSPTKAERIRDLLSTLFCALPQPHFLQ